MYLGNGWNRCFSIGCAGLLAISSRAEAQWLRRPCPPTPSGGQVMPWMEPTPAAAMPPSAIAPAPNVNPMTPDATAPMTSPAPSQAPDPSFQPIASAALGDNSVAVGFQPAMFGDTGPIVTVSPSTTPGNSGTSGTGTSGAGTNGAGTPTTTNGRTRIQIPLVSYAGYRIAENESPRPTDRVFATYNYYNGVPTTPGFPGFDVHREIIGFEKTLLDGQASIGVRIPFLQLVGSDDERRQAGLSSGQFGDVTIVTKYAFYDDRGTGNLISGGLLVTVPTGEAAIVTNNGAIHSTLYQPWTGFIWNFGDTFIHGFSSVVIPDDRRDVTAWYNDLGVGFWLRKDQRDNFFHGIVPTAEIHLGTPLRSGSVTDFDRAHMSDYLSLVGGVNFVFGTNSTIGISTGAPVVGPKPWQLEAHVSINFRF